MENEQQRGPDAPVNRAATPSHRVQRLVVGAADDPAEHEAERLADVIMSRLDTLSTSMFSPPTTRIARRPASAAPAESSSGGGAAPAGVQRHIARTAGSGQPLPADVGSSMGAALGVGLDGVRVHTDADSAASAAAIDATAYTVGNDIYFGSGAYQPDSSDGQHLLAHELAHVVQQGGATVRRHRDKARQGIEQRRVWKERLQGQPLNLAPADADLLVDTFAGKGPSITVLEGLAPLIAGGWTAASVVSLIRKYHGDPGGKSPTQWATVAQAPALVNVPDVVAPFARIGAGWTSGALAVLATAFQAGNGGLSAAQWATLATAHDDVANQTAQVIAFAQLAGWNAPNKLNLLKAFCSDGGALSETEFAAVATAHAALANQEAHVVVFARLASWTAAGKRALALAWGTDAGTLAPTEWATIATAHQVMHNDAAAVAGFARTAGWSAAKKAALAGVFGTDPGTRNVVQWVAIAEAHAALIDKDDDVAKFARMANGWTAANVAALAGLFGANAAGRPAQQWVDIAIADAELADEEQLVAELARALWVTSDVTPLFTGASGAGMGAAELVTLLKVAGTPVAGRAMVVAGWTASHLGTFAGTLHAGGISTAASATFLSTPNMPAASFAMRTSWSAADLGEMVVGALLAGTDAPTMRPLLAFANFPASSHGLIAGTWTARLVGQFCGGALGQGVTPALLQGLIVQANAPAALARMTAAAWTQRRLGIFTAAALAAGCPSARLQLLMEDAAFPAGSHLMEAGPWALDDLGEFVFGIDATALAIADIGALTNTANFAARSHPWIGAGYTPTEVGTICGRARLINGGAYTAVNLTTFLGTPGASANAVALNWWTAADVGDTIGHCRTQAGPPTDAQMVTILQHAATPANGTQILPLWVRTAATGATCGAPSWPEFIAHTPTFQANWLGGPAGRADQGAITFNGAGPGTYRIRLTLYGERISHVEQGHTYEYHFFNYNNCTRVGVGINGFASFEPPGSLDPYVTNQLIALRGDGGTRVYAENAAWGRAPTNGLGAMGYKVGVLRDGNRFGPPGNPIYPTYISQAYPTAGTAIRGKVLVSIGRFFGQIP